MWRKESIMSTNDRQTVERNDGNGWNHRTTYDPTTNNRWSHDERDSGLRGIGSNWYEVKNPHHTNQNDKSHSNNVRFGEST